MDNKKISRRSLIQTASALLVGTAISPALIGQQPGALSQEEPKTIFIPPCGGRKGKISDSSITFKLDKAQTSGQFGAIELTIPPGKLGAPPHYHKTFDEICIVLEGTVHIIVEEEVYEVKKGGWHLRPRGKVHTFWNAGKTDATIIELCSPGGHEAYMLELSQLFDNGANPKPGDLGKLASKHDLVLRFDLLDGIIKKYGVSL